jgi:sugar phosphate isomerase/epimerase
MRVGIDTFTLRELELNPFQQLDYIKERSFEGAQFGGLQSLSAELDPGELGELRGHADTLGLYCQVSVSSPNPHLGADDADTCIARISREIRAAAACGWHELHSSLGGDRTRFDHPVPWPQHLADSAELIAQLAPVLREHGSRINLENHGDTTTFELVQLAESVGPEIAGICLDTANVLCLAEDPVAGAKRAAPYTHLTHTKDAIVYFCDHGVQRQGRPPGEGALDWEQILPILAEYEPDLPLSIEDHKWLFEARFFDPEWLAAVPELLREDLVEVVRLAWHGQQKIDAGAWPAPEAYEAIPFMEQIEERLASGREYLMATLEKLNLRSESQTPS